MSVSPRLPLARTDPQTSSPDLQVGRARTSLRQVLHRYSAYLRTAKSHPIGIADAELRSQMEQLSQTLNKLDQFIVRVSVFGLVSRGKSAVLNALLGQKLLPTGPLNGVTQAPRSLLWSPGEKLGEKPGQPLDTMRIELIDTPGLDEIEGQARAEMAQTIAQQSDLILFVVSGDITRTEYAALCELRRAQKPLLLVFNKVDLYPDQTRQAIYQNLQQLAARSQDGASLQRLLSANEIVLVAAEPAPVQVRIELPGDRPSSDRPSSDRVSYSWEAPPPQIEPLKHKILEILTREGRSLLALNALVQTRNAEVRLAETVLELRRAEAETLIWRFVRYKAIAVAFNPIAGLDVIGGFVSDLAMIRALSELYGLPVTRYEAGKLWKTILLSSGSLLISEFGSNVLFGLGKGFSTIASTAIAQAGIAGYGTYIVGRAIQVYLEQGCSWGAQGASTIIQEILEQVPPNTIIHRLRQELGRTPSGATARSPD